MVKSKTMDVIRIFNGLGNQMSQYAFYLAKKKAYPRSTCFISNQYESENVHNGYELARVFGITRDTIKERLLYQFMQSMYFPVFGHRVLGHFAHPIVEAPNYDFNPEMLKPAKGRGLNFFWGGWHSEKYFKHIRKEILKVFTFDETRLNASSVQCRKRILTDGHSCSIHIRRGDFLKDKKWADAIPEDYYDKAVEYMRNLFPHIQFYVFSNDLDWCKEKFGDDKFYYVQGNSGLDAWQDMYLMTQCHHHINANSTFSWWGAWLCNFSGSITIVPKAFRSDMVTTDVYPEGWIKL